MQCDRQTDNTVVPEVQQLLCFNVALVRHRDSDSCNNVWWSSLLLWILVTCNHCFYISSSQFNPSKVWSLALALRAESLALALRVKSLLTSLLNNNRDDIYGAVIMAKPLRGGRQPSDQANRLGLRICQKEMAATVHIHHRHFIYSARELILILPSHGGWKAEST